MISSSRLPAPFLSGVAPALLGTLCLVLLLIPAQAFPAQWRVVPARVFLEREAKSSVITVVNEGDEKINLQVQAVEWSQDADGKDVYRETGDLIFFPRILQIGKGEQRLIRAGIKMAVPANEKTYRLFIEEIPQPKKSTPDSTQLTVAIKFGVPFFVRPVKDELGGELAKSALAKGVYSVTVKNTGNAHFRITDVSIQGKNAKGEETFASKLNGWYLLTGASRTYTAPIPQDKCSGTRQLAVTVATDTKITLTGTLDVDKAQCLP